MIIIHYQGWLYWFGVELNIPRYRRFPVNSCTWKMDYILCHFIRKKLQKINLSKDTCHICTRILLEPSLLANRTEFILPSKLSTGDFAHIKPDTCRASPSRGALWLQMSVIMCAYMCVLGSKFTSSCLHREPLYQTLTR